jgi:hypothetical protein
MVGNHARPCRDQKSGQFLVRTPNRKHRSKLQIIRIRGSTSVSAFGAVARSFLEMARAKSGHISVRTSGLKLCLGLHISGTDHESLAMDPGEVGGSFRQEKKRTYFGAHPCPKKGANP